MSQQRQQQSQSNCLPRFEDDAPLENETFGADNFFTASPNTNARRPHLGGNSTSLLPNNGDGFMHHNHSATASSSLNSSIMGSADVDNIGVIQSSCTNEDGSEIYGGATSFIGTQSFQQQAAEIHGASSSHQAAAQSSSRPSAQHQINGYQTTYSQQSQSQHGLAYQARVGAMQSLSMLGNTQETQEQFVFGGVNLNLQQNNQPTEKQAFDEKLIPNNNRHSLMLSSQLQQQISESSNNHSSNVRENGISDISSTFEEPSTLPHNPYAVFPSQHYNPPFYNSHSSLGNNSENEFLFPSPQSPKASSETPMEMPSEIPIPLSRWLLSVSSRSLVAEQLRKSLIRKTTVAYGISELLCYHFKPVIKLKAGSGPGILEVVEEGISIEEELFNIMNFVVCQSNSTPTGSITGIDMISPPISLKFIEPLFLSDAFLSDETNHAADVLGANQPKPCLGRFLEVEINGVEIPSRADKEAGSEHAAESCCSSEENLMCHLFGALMYELYSERAPFDGTDEAGADNNSQQKTVGLCQATNDLCSSNNKGSLNDSEHSFSKLEPSRKKNPSDLSFRETNPQQHATSHHDCDDGSSLRSIAYNRAVLVSPKSGAYPPNTSYTPLKELGYPASLSLLIQNLLECGWDEFKPDVAMPSLKTASDDLHLLLLDPERFLFDRTITVMANAVAPAAITLDARESDNSNGRIMADYESKAGSTMLDIKQNKLYGRESEQSVITDVFCRVSLTGESEAIFIEGFSGSGKSRLVQSVVAYVDVSGGYVVQKKFDQISPTRPMSVVLAAFDDLCSLIAAKLPPKELNQIVINLMAVFGCNHLSTLSRVLPSVALLSPKLTNAVSFEDCEVNLSSVYFTLQLFMRVVSSKAHPVMLFLDDLHWADNASLDVLQCILSDIKGASCVYFVGNYRSNEVPPGHAIFRFIDALESCNVKLSKVRLDGMEPEDINHIMSDALGTFPRICKPLSQLVLRKTEGNPLFVLECLRSLVDRDLLQYSFRERRWVWDMDKIDAVDLSDNVCELLKAKMIGLSENTQQALKIASCFGNTIHMAIVDVIASASSNIVDMIIPESPNFAFQSELDNAVKDCFMNKNSDGSGYKFTHDKVREAAYDLIAEEEREQFHHNIGILLYYSTQGQNIDGQIFSIVDQINHSTINDPQLQIEIAQLNYKAASKALNNSNFAAAYFYSNAAIKLLPPDHWECHYDLSRGVFLVQGNAAYTDGREQDATEALDMILLHGKSLKDKLDAYHLKISLMHRRQQGQEAYDLGLEVLEQLGEKIPKSVDPESFKTTVATIQSKLGKMDESALMNMKVMADPIIYSLMQFYNHVSHISFFLNPSMLKWYAAKQMELTLEHGVCKYSALGIMVYSMILGGKLIQDVEGGYRLGKISLKLLERFDQAQDLIPNMYLCYYGFIAVHIEPFQSCADMLKRGMEIGLSTGDIQMALLIGPNYVQKSLISGMNLPDLKKEWDYQMRLIDTNSQPFFKMYMSRLHQSIVKVIAQRDPTVDPDRPGEDVASVTEFSESQTFHNVWQSFWLGHYDRCLYHAEKSSASADISKVKSIMTMFYGALSCFHGRQKYSSNRELIKITEQAAQVIREKSEKSPWNYQNKLHLLEAEMFSARRHKDRARISFNAAITAARSSKFIHEQGLACELAAMHCMRYGDGINARSFFNQALECYSKWGSQVKIDHINRQLERLA